MVWGCVRWETLGVRPRRRTPLDLKTEKVGSEPTKFKTGWGPTRRQAPVSLDASRDRRLFARWRFVNRTPGKVPAFLPSSSNRVASRRHSAADWPDARTRPAVYLCHPRNVEVHLPGQAIEGSFKTEGLSDRHDRPPGTTCPGTSTLRSSHWSGASPGAKRGGQGPLRLVTVTACPVSLPALSGSHRAGWRPAVSRPPLAGFGGASGRFKATRRASPPVFLGE